jgi:hypothetical protein
MVMVSCYFTFRRVCYSIIPVPSQALCHCRRSRSSSTVFEARFDRELSQQLRSNGYHIVLPLPPALRLLLVSLTRFLSITMTQSANPSLTTLLTRSTGNEPLLYQQ